MEVKKWVTIPIPTLFQNEVKKRGMVMVMEAKIGRTRRSKAPLHHMLLQYPWQLG